MVEIQQDTEVQLRIENIHLSFGTIKVLTDVSMQVRKGEILAIIGPNGAGKTCLLNCTSGFYFPQKGEIFFENQRITNLPPHKIPTIGIARTFQNIELFTGMSTLDNLLAAKHNRIKYGTLSGSVYFGRARREEVRNRKIIEEEIIDLLEIEAIRKHVVGTLPYGMRKRVELGRALAIDPKILLLDEPMAGMNVEEKEDMARFILDVHDEKGTTIVLIEHDMGLVMDIAERIVVLDFGQKIAEGTPEDIKGNPRVINAYLGEEETS